MEITLHKLQHSSLIALDLSTQTRISIRSQTLDYAINHCLAEDIILLEYLSLALQAGCRSLTIVGQLLQ